MKNKILVLCISLALVGSAYASKDSPKEKSSVLSVSLKKPELKELEGSMAVSGNVVAWQESSISGELAGTKIEEVLSDVGDYVKKGQVLARLNKQSVLMDLEQANASLEEANANLYVAEQNAERVRKLEGTAALSEMQKNQYFASEKQARAKVDSAKAMVNNLKIKLSQTNVVAPEDGTISERKATVGTIIGTGEMFKLIVKDKLQWQPTIASDKLVFIKKGQKVNMKLSSGETISATIDEISPKVNSITRQGTIIVNLPSDVHKKKISPGMFLSGEILSAKQSEIVVSKSSVILRDGVNYVFMVENNKAIQKPVKIGKKIGDLVIIKEGLTSDKEIVALGAGFLKDGDKVTVVKGK